MLIDLLEISSGSLITLTTFGIIKIIQKRKANKKEPLSYKWNRSYHHFIDGSEGWGWRCPKCDLIGIDYKKDKICDCFEFPREHFHRICAACNYKFIMRTKDDK